MRSPAAAVTLVQLAALLTILIAADAVRADPSASGPVQSPSGPSRPTEPTSDSPGGESPATEHGAHAPRRANRLVFTCRDGATPVFSDRPCGQEEQRRRLEVPSPAAGSAPSTRPAAAPAATRPSPARAPRRVIPDSADIPASPDRCARLEAELASIDARMRQGYSAREAARLWQRWREAKAKLRAARC